MKAKSLLTQLSELEDSLNDFSFGELTVEDATRLKTFFSTFKDQLEKRIWGEGNKPQPDAIQEDPSNAHFLQQEHAGKLIATVSHEMRTPLNGIIGFTDLLKETDLSSDQQAYIDAICSASQSLMGIINELLEYSKLSAELHRSENVDFNLASVVSEVVYLCKTLILEKDVSIELKADAQIPQHLKGDPSKLSQVLLNLLGNAVKFVDKGSIVLEVTLQKIVNDTCWLIFKVTDTGIGIAEEDLHRIFDSFRQADEGTFAKYGGSGLGLSIVKQIIEQQNGEIKVESTLHQGTTFTFILPFEIGGDCVQPKIREQEKIPAWLKGMHILVFEDNPLNQRLVGSRLKAWGCKYYVTENALHGLRILESNPIEMVLMDLRMPVMDGFEVTARIRSSKKEGIREVPIIALTADFTVEDQAEFNNSGIDDYLLKPYSPSELLSKIKKNRKEMSKYIKMPSVAIGNGETALADAVLVDLEPILKECMGEESLLRELVILYKQNALEFIGKVKVHLDQEDLEAVGFAAHKIKSGLKMMRSEGLLAIVEQLHKASKENGDLKHMKFLHNCFVDEYPAVEAAIDKALENLKI